MKFVIDRAEWLNASVADEYEYERTALYEPESQMSCCIGHCVAQVLDIPRIELAANATAHGWADGLDSKRSITISRLKRLGFVEEGSFAESWYDTPWIEEAYNINDRSGLTSQEREEKLIAHFKDNGHELEFVGEYP